jgi:hypothetical protein
VVGKHRLRKACYQRCGAGKLQPRPSQPPEAVLPRANHRKKVEMLVPMLWSAVAWYFAIGIADFPWSLLLLEVVFLILLKRFCAPETNVDVCQASN